MIWPDHYRFYPELFSDSLVDRFQLRAISWSDREPIREWRNSQLEVLRQIKPLTPEDQDRYFLDVVRPQFDMEFPPQFMFAFLQGSELIGYGALVHIHWGDLRGEVSFLTSPDRLDNETFENDWNHYLELLKPVARELGLHKLTTETYSMRKKLMRILEANGFVQEGVLSDHHRIDGKFTDSYIHAFKL